MITAEQKTTNEQASASIADASVTDVLSAWDKVFQGVKARMRTNATLVASDFRLSIKAVVVTLISILVLVSLVMVLWVSLLAGMTYGLTSYGVHWLWSLVLVIALNIAALVMTKTILTFALSSVKMKASADLLFNSDSDQA
jgi:hypothetical protein